MVVVGTGVVGRAGADVCSQWLSDSGELAGPQKKKKGSEILSLGWMDHGWAGCTGTWTLHHWHPGPDRARIARLRWPPQAQMGGEAGGVRAACTAFGTQIGRFG